MLRERAKLNNYIGTTRLRWVQILSLTGLLYMMFINFEVPFVFFSILRRTSSISRPQMLDSEELLQEKEHMIKPTKERLMVTLVANNGLIFDWRTLSNSTKNDGFLGLNRSVISAFQLGEKLWEDLNSGKMEEDIKMEAEIRRKTPCPNSISMSGAKFANKGNAMVLPCGLGVGSHITVVATPRTILKDSDQSVKMSQFMLELIGLKTIDEDPPKIFHYNPRWKGDWSGKPVVEQNTCYNKQWGISVRCQGLNSTTDEETVDGLIKCEKWIHDDDNSTKESPPILWLSKHLSRLWKTKINYPFPFIEENLFVMTLNVGIEGYHVNVDERHITSFPYRIQFSIEEASELTLYGDIDVHFVSVASLPSLRPNYSPQRHLDMYNRWKIPPLPNSPVELFIGILSNSNHFVQRMGARKSWMQHRLIKSSKVVTRFFVALHSNKEVNVVLKKEAQFFGDIVIVPYMDRYDLMVLKTLAIIEYGVGNVDAEHIMKCDDDTFVRVDAVINEINKIEKSKNFYMGNIIHYSRPFRSGKWAVTYEEWSDDYYPHYASGSTFILSSKITHYIISEFQKHKLRLFTMEDVCVGIWVDQFNNSKPVEYVNNLKFCWTGCLEDYYTAHNQSPEQMICLWEKLQQLGRPVCCDMI